MKSKIPTYSFETTSKGEKLADVLKWDAIESYNFNEPHNHEFHEIMFFIKGGGSHYINNVWAEIEDFEVHILPAQFIHLLNRNKNSKGFTIAFTNQFIEQLHRFEPSVNLLDFVTTPSIALCSKTFFTENKMYFDELLKSENKGVVFYNLISLVLFKLFATINQEQMVINTAYKDFGMLFHKLFNDNFKTEKNIDFYASKLGVSKTTLNLELHKYFGKNFKSIFAEKIITEAKQLLIKNEMNITEISYELGFCDLASFSNMFKKITQFTPKAFQKKFSIYK